MNILSKWTAKGRMAAVLVLGAVIALSSGCREEDPPAISVSQQMFRVDIQDHVLPLRVMSNAEWTATYSAGAKYNPNDNTGWLTLSREKGRGSADLSIFVEPYTGALKDGRQAILTFTVNGAVATVIVNQSETATTLQVSPPEFEIGAQGGNAYFTILSNTDWEILGAADWAHLSQTTGTGNATITITVDENQIHSTGGMRDVTYTIAAGSGGATVSETFELIQKDKPDPTIVLSQEAVNFPAEVDGTVPPVTANVTVVTNVTMPAGTQPDVTVGEGWLSTSVSQTTGGIWVIAIDPTDNPAFTKRETVINVTIPDTDAVGGYVMKQIIVTQDAANAPTLKMSRNQVIFEAKGVAPDYTVTEFIGYIATGGTPTVVNYPGWFESAPTVAGGVITAVATPNYTLVERTGVIHVVVQVSGAYAEAYVNVIQKASDVFNFNVTPKSVAAAQAGETVNVTAYSLEDMSIVGIIQIDGSWITSTVGLPVAASPIVSGSSASSIMLPLDIAANTDAASRTGTVQIIAISGGQPDVQVVTVTQAGVGGPDIKVIPSSVIIPNTLGATAPLAVLHGTGVTIATAVAPVGWLTATPDATTDPTGITLEVTAVNGSVKDREASLFVWATKGNASQLIEVKIVQPGVGTTELDVATLFYEVEAAGRTISIPVQGLNGTTWGVSGVDDTTPSMYTTAPAPNGTTSVDAVVAANTSSTERYSYIYLLATNGDTNKIYAIVVKQEGLVPVKATLAADKIGVQWEAGVADNMIVINDLPEGAVVADINATADASWLTLGVPVITGTTATIEMTVAAENPRVTARDAHVSIGIKRGNDTKTLTATVTQEAAPGPQVMLATDKVVIPATSPAASTFDLTFFNTTSNVVYSVASSDPTFVTGAVTSNVLTITQVSAENTGSADIEADLTIEAVAGGVTSLIKVKVIQLGVGAPNLTLSANSFVFGPAAQDDVSLFFMNTNKAAVTVFSKPAWVTEVTWDAGMNGQGAYVFDVDANTTSEERGGQIILQAILGGQTVYYPVQVAQNGLSALAISVAPAWAVTDNVAKTIDDIIHVLNVPDNTTVSVSSTKAWLTVPATVATPYTFSPDVTDNTGSQTRNGTVIVTATRGTETQSVTVNVWQLAQSFVQPAANATPNSVLFAADQTAPETKTVTIQNTSDTYIHSVTVPGWATATAVTATGTTATFDVTAGTNATATPLTGNIVIYIQNGDKSQTITIPVSQKALLAPIFPTAMSATFPAVSSGVGSAQPIELIGFNTTDYIFTYTQEGSWFTVVPPASPMQIYPNNAYTGTTPRVGKVNVTIKAVNDPAYLSQFTITVVQEGVAAPNIGYGPKDHTFPQEGGIASTLFANPEGLTLQMVSATSTTFVSSVAWSVANQQLDITVQPNPSGSTRSTVLQVVTKDANGNVIGQYPISVVQAGILAAAPTFLATFITAPAVVTEATVAPANVVMGLDPGVTIISVTPAVGAKAWLTNLVVDAVLPGFTYEIDPVAGAADWPAPGTSNNTLVAVEVSDDGGLTSHILYYSITAFNPVLPEILATIAPASGTILAADTDIAALAVPSLTCNGATIGTVTASCVGGGTWLNSATISTAGDVLTITGIDANTTTADRSAIITIPLTKANHMNQTLTYVLIQKGVPTIDAVWESSYIAVDTDTQLVAVPTANANAGAPDAATIVAPAWVTSTNVVNSDQIELNFAANLTAAPLYGVVTFTMKKTGYADQACSFTVIQLPHTTTALLNTISTPADLAYSAGSTTTFTYVKPDPATVLTIWTPYDSFISNVADNGVGTMTITTASLNATGAAKTGHVLLKAVNGAITEWYQVPVNQVSMTQADLYSLISFSGTGVVFNSAAHTVTRTGVGTGFGSANIDFNIAGVPAGSTFTLVENSDPNNAWSVSSSSTTLVRLTRAGIWNGGPCVYTYTVNTGSISAPFTITAST